MKLREFARIAWQTIRSYRNPTRWDFAYGVFVLVFFLSGVPDRVIARHKPSQDIWHVDWPLVAVLMVTFSTIGWLSTVVCRMVFEEWEQSFVQRMRGIEDNMANDDDLAIEDVAERDDHSDDQT